MAADAQLIQAARRVAQSRVNNLGGTFLKAADPVLKNITEKANKKAAADAKKAKELNAELAKDLAEVSNVLDLSKLSPAETAVTMKGVNILYDKYNETNRQLKLMTRQERRSEKGVELQNRLIAIERGIDRFADDVTNRYQYRVLLNENKNEFSEDPFNKPNLAAAKDFNKKGITGYATDKDGVPTFLKFGSEGLAVTEFTAPYTTAIADDFDKAMGKGLAKLDKDGYTQDNIDRLKRRLNNMLKGVEGTKIAYAFEEQLRMQAAQDGLELQRETKDFSTPEAKAELIDEYIDKHVTDMGQTKTGATDTELAKGNGFSPDQVQTLREDVKKGTGTIGAQIGNTTFQILVEGKNKITLVKGNNPVDTFTSVDDLISRYGYIFQK